MRKNLLSLTLFIIATHSFTGSLFGSIPPTPANDFARFMQTKTEYDRHQTVKDGQDQLLGIIKRYQDENRAAFKNLEEQVRELQRKPSHQDQTTQTDPLRPTQ